MQLQFLICYKKKQQQQGLEITMENYFRLGGREGLGHFQLGSENETVDLDRVQEKI